jgi:hypothetical protein
MALRRIIVSLARYDHRFVGELAPVAEERLRERLVALRQAGAIINWSSEGLQVDDNMADLPGFLDGLEAQPRQTTREGAKS